MFLRSSGGAINILLSGARSLTLTNNPQYRRNDVRESPSSFSFRFCLNFASPILRKGSALSTDGA